MAQVNVTINGRQFRMACADGEEAHLQLLAKALDERISGLRTQFGEIGDARLTVMAALLIADELSEIGKKVVKLEAELAGLKGTQSSSADNAQSKEAAIAAAFNAMAERIEGLAKKLNQVSGGGVAQG
ncbi:MAG: cell division protein ZapA [Alphaproteobacteria bacterium]|nr:cell division protein ZapA [Alphaproteobacteria bacterium]